MIDIINVFLDLSILISSVLTITLVIKSGKKDRNK